MAPAQGILNGALAVAGAALGVSLLRISWARRAGGGWLTVAGWLAFFAGLVAWHRAGLGWDEALAYAMLAPCLIAFLFLAHRMGWGAALASVSRAGTREYRASARARAEPAESERGPAGRRPSPAQAARTAPVATGWSTRGVAQALLAGPLALAAALGLAALIALRAPWVAADRLVTAGFLLPIAWAAGAIWATMDSKLTRVAVTLSLTAVICVGGAIV